MKVFYNISNCTTELFKDVKSSLSMYSEFFIIRNMKQQSIYVKKSTFIKLK